MPMRTRLFFAALSLGLFFVAAAPLMRELTRRSDIWWTPYAKLVPLAQSKDRVEIYARGKALTVLLEAGQLQLAGESGSSPLVAGDIGLRFNNWERLRAERLPFLLLYAAACGFIACIFLLALTGRIAYRGEKAQSTSPQEAQSTGPQ